MRWDWPEACNSWCHIRTLYYSTYMQSDYGECMWVQSYNRVLLCDIMHMSHGFSRSCSVTSMDSSYRMWSMNVWQVLLLILTHPLGWCVPCLPDLPRSWCPRWPYRGHDVRRYRIQCIVRNSISDHCMHKFYELMVASPNMNVAMHSNNLIALDSFIKTK